MLCIADLFREAHIHRYHVANSILNCCSLCQQFYINIHANIQGIYPRFGYVNQGKRVIFMPLNKIYFSNDLCVIPH